MVFLFKIYQLSILSKFPCYFYKDYDILKAVARPEAAWNKGSGRRVPLGPEAVEAAVRREAPAV